MFALKLVGLSENILLTKEHETENNMDIQFRKALPKDMPGIHALVRELAEYEKGLDYVTTTPESYTDDFSKGWFDAFIAEENDKIIGIALYTSMFSTWRGRMLYLEDFVVRESYRGHGVGKKLFEMFLDEARRQKAKLVKWQVLDWNEPGINFYKKYDTVFDKEWIDCKIYFE